MPDRRPPWAGDEPTAGGGTPRRATYGPQNSQQQGRQPRPYRRATPAGADANGFVWIEPSATQWPNVKGNPPGPRTQQIGYNREERAVRCVFRDGTKWRYDEVPPDVWERIRRTASTGRFIARVLDQYPYGADNW
jgi:hypothetical protein